MRLILTALAITIGLLSVALPASAHGRKPFDGKAFWEEQANRNG